MAWRSFFNKSLPVALCFHKRSRISSPSVNYYYHISVAAMESSSSTHNTDHCVMADQKLQVMNNEDNIISPLVVEPLQTSSETSLQDPPLDPVQDPPLDPVQDPPLDPVQDPPLDPVQDPPLDPVQDPPLDPVQDPPSTNQIANSDVNRYSYTFRGFTSEIFKIEIVNLPPYVGFKQVRQRLAGLKLNPVKVKMSASCCFVTFRSEEERQEAIKLINGHVWKKIKLRAIPAKPALDPVAKRKRNAMSNDDSQSKRVCKDEENPKSIEERLADAITPLLHIPYEEQLIMKTKNINDYLIKVARNIRRLKPVRQGVWFDEHVSANNGLFCPLLPIKPSPVLTEYRNKCELTIGLGADNHTVVGFRVGAYRHGDLTVAPPTSCIVSSKTKQIVEIFQKVISESSLKPFDCQTVDGHWKQLIVRHFTTGDTMAIIQLQRQELSEGIIAKEKQTIMDAFKDNDKILTSLYWQTLNNRQATREITSYELLLGKEHIHEELLGVEFRVSADAFFQINTKAAEVLYRTIGELVADEGTDPIIYDICCGTGSISISIAKNGNFSKIIGIEMSSQAVNDAIYNATVNGICDAEFVCGKVENNLTPLTTKRNHSIIAIADPPRSGLHQKVIQAIRRCTNIDTLIYVSCNPEGTMDNFTDLCRLKSKRVLGEPFCPVKAIPIDMFPHTSHCELIVVFKRNTGISY